MFEREISGVKIIVDFPPKGTMRNYKKLRSIVDHNSLCERFDTAPEIVANGTVIMHVPVGSKTATLVVPCDYNGSELFRECTEMTTRIFKLLNMESKVSRYRHRYLIKLYTKVLVRSVTKCLSDHGFIDESLYLKHTSQSMKLGYI